MQDKKIKEIKKIKSFKDQQPTPLETGGVHVTGHIKIFDPNTNDVLVNKREEE